MPKITIGPLKIPRLELFGVQITPEITLLPKITVFDPQWIIDTLMESAEWFSEAVKGVVEVILPWIIESVFNAVEPYLDGLAAAFYEAHPEEEEWI